MYKASTNDVFDINIFEIGAILLAFQRWGHSWKHKKVVVHTDSNTAKEGLSKLTLKGEANAVLRRILLTAAELDISITPTWIAGSDNELADAISRFDDKVIAEWCPTWQTSSSSLLLRNDGYTVSELTRAF